jgi:N-acetyl-anhydromuramyl-L-alanine amidase AmpD
MIIKGTVQGKIPMHEFVASPSERLLVLHSLTIGESGFKNLDEIFKYFQNPPYKESFNFLIDENGGIWEFVPHTKSGNHAGYSCHPFFQDVKNLNRYSWSIEFIYRKSRGGYTDEQYIAYEEIKKFLGVDKLRITTHQAIRDNYKVLYDNTVPSKYDPIYFSFDRL